MSRLRPAMSVTDFARAELDAMVLDGTAYRVDDCAAALDEPLTADLRAAAVAADLGDRLIAERHTAAWIWGARLWPPLHHDLCSAIEARTRVSIGPVPRVREVVLSPGDTVAIGAIRVTTPLRTAIDIARIGPTWTTEDRDIVARLMRIGDFGLVECEALMNRRRNLPNKLAAVRRLAQASSIARTYPELTRYTS